MTWDSVPKLKAQASTFHLQHGPAVAKNTKQKPRRKDDDLLIATPAEQVFRDHYILMPENITQWMGIAFIIIFLKKVPH